MGGTIQAYIDIASLYSYLAFVELSQQKEALQAYGVTIDLIPVLLGAINVGSGNKPPWTVPAKARYLSHDSRRSALRLGLALQPPEDLMTVGMTVLPLRALHHIKATRPEPAYLATFAHLFHRFWTAPNSNFTQPEVLAAVLAEVPAAATTSNGIETLFTPDEVKTIMSATATQEIRDSVKKSTQEALDRGAYGAPWLWVANDAGTAESFFGSDRFGQVYRFLGVPFQDITILPPGARL